MCNNMICWCGEAHCRCNGATAREHDDNHGSDDNEQASRPSDSDEGAFCALLDVEHGRRYGVAPRHFFGAVGRSSAFHLLRGRLDKNASVALALTVSRWLEAKGIGEVESGIK